MDMVTAKQRQSPDMWTKDVARVYGRILREMSALHKLLRNISQRFGVDLPHIDVVTMSGLDDMSMWRTLVDPRRGRIRAVRRA